MSATVSVVIPAYNAASTIDETIESILAQTFADFDLTVIDNASTDDTVARIEKFDDPRITVKVNDKNYGPFENWNRAIKAASGRYVKLVCADDLIDPTIIERQVAIFENPSNNGVVMVASQRRVIDDNGNVLMKARGLAGMDGRVEGTSILRRAVRSGTNPIGEAAGVLLKTESIQAQLPWSDAFPYMIDVEMWLRILETGDLYAIAEPLCAFRVSANSWSGQVVKKQRQQASAFFGALRQRRPDLISAFDVKVGTVQAELLSQARRAVYWRLARTKK